MKILTKKCIVCGKKFAKPESCGLPEWFGCERRPNGRRFCSTNCSAKYHYEERLGNYKFTKERHYIPPTAIKKGQRLSPKTEFKKGLIPWNKGRPWTIAERKRISDGLPKRFGKNSGNWKGGVTNDPDYWAVAKAKRKTAILKNGGSHTLQEWNELKRKYNYTCPHCGKKEPEIKLTQDHIIPLSKGGSNDIKNIQPLCKKGNSIKNAKIL
jgi:hypothetical protein